MDENYLENFCLTPTRGQNILDLVLCNNPSLVGQIFTLISKGISDHDLLEINIDHPYTRPQDDGPREVPYVNKFHQFDLLGADKEDWMRYEAELMNVDFDTATEGMNVKEKLAKLYEIIEEASELIFRKKEYVENGEEEKEEKEKNKVKNKIPRDVRLLMRQKHELSERIKKSNHWLKTVKLTKELEAKESELLEKYQEHKLKVEKEALGKIKKKDPKFFYSYAKKSAKTSSEVGTLVGPDGSLCSSTLDKVECLRQQYESVYTLPDKTFLVDDPQIFFNSKDVCARCSAEEVHECEDDMFESEPARLFVHGDSEEAFRRRNPAKPVKSDIFFDHTDVIDAIKKIPNGASPGPDGVPTCLLKKGATSIALMLTNVLRSSFETGEIPDILKLGLISPIHKGGSTSDPANFRPVALTSHIAKTGERIIREQLVAYLESIDKMDNSQHGS